MQKILVICTGNICRSPLAAALLAREMPGLEVSSAGLDALIGMPADPLAVQVGTAHGLDLSAHRARRIGAVHCHQSQLLLVMTRSQKVETEQRFPLTRGKVYLLGHHSRFEVADPYRQPLSAFEAAYADIERGVHAWCQVLRQLN